MGVSTEHISVSIGQVCTLQLTRYAVACSETDRSSFTTLQGKLVRNLIYKFYDRSEIASTPIEETYHLDSWPVLPLRGGALLWEWAGQ
jgi:hypothetical protein